MQSGRVRLYLEACNRRTRDFKGNSDSIKREKKSTVRGFKPWDRLAAEVVESPSLEIFKTQLHKALSNPM